MNSLSPLSWFRNKLHLSLPKKKKKIVYTQIFVQRHFSTSKSQIRIRVYAQKRRLRVSSSLCKFFVVTEYEGAIREVKWGHWSHIRETRSLLCCCCCQKCCFDIHCCGENKIDTHFNTPRQGQNFVIFLSLPPIDVTNFLCVGDRNCSDQ